MEPIVAFVAYASDDGFDFATILVDWLDRCDPPVTAWIDRDNPQDKPFEIRIENAIIGSHVVLLVLTEGAVVEDSWARREMLMAAEWKKPVLAVRPPGSRAMLPISSQGAAVIDVSESKDAWRHLANELRNLQPANKTIMELTALRDELEVRARRSRGDSRDALRARSGLISAVVQQEQRRVRDPKGAVRGVGRLISEGQRKDAAGETTAPPEGLFRIVDGPPAISGAGLHDRYDERDMLLRLLDDPKIRLVSLCGPAGAGKTTLLSDLVRRLEPLGYAGAAYVSTHGPRRVTPDLLLEKLARTHPDAYVSSLLLERLADRSYNWHQNLNATMELFGERSVLLVVDNAEELLYEGQLTDLHLREFAHTVVNGPSQGVRLLLATRTQGPKAGDSSHARQQVDIPPGLPPPFAAEFVRDLDVGNIVGMKAASDATMRRIYRLSLGHPRALELLYAVLRGERRPDVEEVLRSANEASADGDDGSRYLIRRATARLYEPIRRVLQALAIYDRPVRPSAVSFLLARYDTGLDSTAALNLLCDRRLVRRDGDLYYLPPDPERRTVLQTVPLGRPDDRVSRRPRFTRYALWHQAAEYFRSVRELEVRVHDLNDLAPHFSEIDLRLAGGQYAEAAELINAVDRHLKAWGYRSLVLRQRERLVGQLGTGHAEIGNRYNLATIYLQVSQPDAAIDVLVGANELATAIRPDGDVALQVQLAKAHHMRGELREAATKYKKVLSRGDSKALAAGRLGLAACLNELGEVEQASDQYSAALEVVDNASVEASILLDQGLIQQNLGRPLAALGWIERAHRLARQCSNNLLAAKCVDATAYVLLDTGQLGRARYLAESAIKAATDAGNADLCRETYSTLALAHLLAGKVIDAHAAADAAARFLHNQRPLAALALLGITQLRLRDSRSAELSFRRAKQEVERLLKIEPDSVQVLDMNGLVLVGLARSDAAEDVTPAVTAYQKARKRTRASGVVLRAVRLLDELLDGDRSRQALEILDAARGVDTR
jgi:tetratricopeptide (TPR) repeat protein